MSVRAPVSRHTPRHTPQHDPARIAQMQAAKPKSGGEKLRQFAGMAAGMAQKGIATTGKYLSENREFYRQRGDTSLDEDMRGMGSRFVAGMGETGAAQRRELRERKRQRDSDDELVRFLGGSRSAPRGDEAEDIVSFVIGRQPPKPKPKKPEKVVWKRVVTWKQEKPSKKRS